VQFLLSCNISTKCSLVFHKEEECVNRRPRLRGALWQNLLPKRKLPYIVYDTGIIALRDRVKMLGVVVQRSIFFC
jgi:hypothetical protein